jgi:ParB family transcriptional regulator, chromosome partitioning protein
MSGKKPSLGRGLAELSPLLAQRAGQPASDPGPLAGDRLGSLPLDVLQRGKYQPRWTCGRRSLSELAESIKSQGVVQPILVRPLAPRTGERPALRDHRRRAPLARRADGGPCRNPGGHPRGADEAAVAMALIENIQREDLNPLEEARALSRLIDEFGLTHQAAARRSDARGLQSATCCA